MTHSVTTPVQILLLYTLSPYVHESKRSRLLSSHMVLILTLWRITDSTAIRSSGVMVCAYLAVGCCCCGYCMPATMRFKRSERTLVACPSLADFHIPGYALNTGRTVRLLLNDTNCAAYSRLSNCFTKTQTDSVSLSSITSNCTTKP